MYAPSPVRFFILSFLALLICSAPTVAAEPSGRAASGAIDSVLLQWRAQLKGCAQPSAAELYRLRDVDALLHVAMFEAVNSIVPRDTPFVAFVDAAPGASPEAAAAQAAHDILVAQCPQTAAAAAAALSASLADVRDEPGA